MDGRVAVGELKSVSYSILKWTEFFLDQLGKIEVYPLNTTSSAIEAMSRYAGRALIQHMESPLRSGTAPISTDSL